MIKNDREKPFCQKKMEMGLFEHFVSQSEVLKY